MSQPESPVVKPKDSTSMRLLLAVLIAAAVAYLLATNAEKIPAMLMVLFGFSGVIMIHEFGHLIAGKMTGMKVEAISVGFSPVLLGVRRTEKGMHVRILPTLIPKQGGQPDEGAMDFDFGKGGKPWDTECRIGLIPFGGFVALLGQEDVGVAERGEDPRSFMNKPLLSRIAVIMAGVTFNVISALIIFMIIFQNGIGLQAPVVGGVVLNSPADKAGLKAGDEVISIQGDSFIDYMNIALAGALGHRDKPIDLVIKRTLPDGKSETLPVSVIPKKSLHGAGVMRSIRIFGIEKAMSSQLVKIGDANGRAELLRTTGLNSEETVIAVNGRPVRDGIEMESAISTSLTPEISLTVKRADPETKVVSDCTVSLPMQLSAISTEFEQGYRLDSVLGLVPRLRVVDVVTPSNGRLARIRNWFVDLFVKPEPKGDSLQKGDIFVRIGQCDYPTFADLRSVMTAHTNAAAAHAKDSSKPFDEKMKVVVDRMVDGQPQEVTLELTPQLPEDVNTPSTLGFIHGLDANSPVIAAVVKSPDGFESDLLPRGAEISAIGGRDVKSFFDIIAALRASAGKNVDIVWHKGDAKGVAMVDVPLGEKGYTITSWLAVPVPFDDMRRQYKSDSPSQAIVMGWKRTELFIKQAIVTIQRLLSTDLPASSLNGPLGIVKATYTVASEGQTSFYFYWLGLISASIAVMNLLPLPVLDGGVIVMMLVEKIKGSPISPKVQGALNYAGLALLAALMLYVTFNDIKMLF